MEEHEEKELREKLDRMKDGHAHVHETAAHAERPKKGFQSETNATLCSAAVSR